MYDLDRIPRQSPDAVCREIAGGDEALILHVKSGQYHSINATGAFIWS